METHELNSPMKTSGAVEALRDHPGIDSESPEVQKTKGDASFRLLSFLWRELRPLLFCAVFGTAVGATVVMGINQKIDEEKKRFGLEPPASLPGTTATADLPTVFNVQNLPSSTTSVSLDVDSFVQELLQNCHMPDKTQMLRITLDSKTTDTEKVREIARLLLNADPRNREVLEKALKHILEKWLEQQKKQLSGS